MQKKLFFFKAFLYTTPMPNTDKIQNIILDYCEGIEHLEFSKSEMPDMIREIKLAIINELDDAEHLDDARSYVKEYL